MLVVASLYSYFINHLNQKNMSTSGRVFLGVLAGAAVGATFGILYAPDKGSNTRKKISQGATDKAGQLADKFNGYVDRMGRGIEDVKDEAGNWLKKGEAKVDDAKLEANNMLDRSKAKVEDADKKIAGSYK
jgi:gas vesicle protein